MTTSRIVVLSYNPELYLEAMHSQSSMSDQDDMGPSSQGATPGNRKVLAAEMRTHSSSNVTSRDERTSSPVTRAQLRSDTPPSSVEHQEAATSDNAKSTTNSPLKGSSLGISSSHGLRNSSLSPSIYSSVRQSSQDGKGAAQGISPPRSATDIHPKTYREALHHLHDFTASDGYEDSEASHQNQTWLQDVKIVSDRLNLLKEAYKAILQEKRQRSTPSSTDRDSPGPIKSSREPSVSNEDQETPSLSKDVPQFSEHSQTSQNEDSDVPGTTPADREVNLTRLRDPETSTMY